MRARHRHSYSLRLAARLNRSQHPHQLAALSSSAPCHPNIPQSGSQVACQPCVPTSSLLQSAAARLARLPPNILWCLGVSYKFERMFV